MTTIAFQTGRLYTEQGQRVAAIMLDDGTIIFVDTDRGIDGVIEADRDCQLTAGAVMHMYDHNLYANSGYQFDPDRSIRKGLTKVAQAIAAPVARKWGSA